MKNSSTILLRAVVILVGIGVLALMLWEPHLEGRNAHATLFEIYFKDPFLAYAYSASICFFAALYQIFKLLGFVGRGEAFSQPSLKALRTVKYCAMALVAFIFAAQCYLFVVVRGEDDIAGGVAMSTFMILVCVVIATVAAVFQRRVQSALKIESENGVTT